MKFKLPIVLCMLLCIVQTPSYYSQVTVEQTSEDKYVRVMLHEGDVYDGFLIEITEETILIDTEMLGKMRFNKLEVSQCFEIVEEEIGEFEEDNSRFLELNLQKTRYFYSPSAHQLKKGDGYMHNMYFLYNSMSYGITDYMTAGVVLTPFGAGATFKAGVSANENFAFSAGGQVLMPYNKPTWYNDDLGFDDINSPVYLGFGNVTIGSSKMSLTLNYGYGSFTRQKHLADDPDGQNIYIDQNAYINMFSTSAMFQMGSTSWLMFEGYYIQTEQEDIDLSYDPELINETGLFMIGVRTAATKRRMLWDIAGVFFPELIADRGMIIPVPFVGLTLPL